MEGGVLGVVTTPRTTSYSSMKHVGCDSSDGIRRSRVPTSFGNNLLGLTHLTKKECLIVYQNPHTELTATGPRYLCPNA